MTIQNPQTILDRIDFAEYDKMRRYSSTTIDPSFENITFAEPAPVSREADTESLQAGKGPAGPTPGVPNPPGTLPSSIQGRIHRFGDSVDTDSIAPTEICLNFTPESLARGAFMHRKPNFYELTQSGATILVAENAFGTGSSREQAPKALIYAGIKAVVARSYAFIYGRNQANNGLLGIKIQDDRFYELAKEGGEMNIDIENRVITCEGEKFEFHLDPIEEKLLAAGGLLNMYNLYGSALFQKLQEAVTSRAEQKTEVREAAPATGDNKLQW